jgi:hypothetical protein
MADEKKITHESLEQFDQISNQAALSLRETVNNQAKYYQRAQKVLGDLLEENYNLKANNADLYKNVDNLSQALVKAQDDAKLWHDNYENKVRQCQEIEEKLNLSQKDNVDWRKKAQHFENLYLEYKQQHLKALCQCKELDELNNNQISEVIEWKQKYEALSKDHKYLLDHNANLADINEALTQKWIDYKEQSDKYYELYNKEQAQKILIKADVQELVTLRRQVKELEKEKTRLLTRVADLQDKLLKLRA